MSARCNTGTVWNLRVQTKIVSRAIPSSKKAAENRLDRTYALCISGCTANLLPTAACVMLMLCGVHIKLVAASLPACNCMQRPAERHNNLCLNLFEFSSVLVRIEAAQESSRILDQYSGLMHCTAVAAVEWDQCTAVYMRANCTLAPTHTYWL